MQTMPISLQLIYEELCESDYLPRLFSQNKQCPLWYTWSQSCNTGWTSYHQAHKKWYSSWSTLFNSLTTTSGPCLLVCLISAELRPAFFSHVLWVIFFLMFDVVYCIPHLCSALYSVCTWISCPGWPIGQELWTLYKHLLSRSGAGTSTKAFQCSCI